MPRRKIKSLTKFLNSYINFENGDLNINFEQEENSLIINNIGNMGIEEGLTQMYTEEAEKLGLEKVKATLVSKLIVSLYFSLEEIAELSGLPLSLVKKLKLSIYD